MGRDPRFATRAAWFRENRKSACGVLGLDSAPLGSRISFDDDTAE